MFIRYQVTKTTRVQKVAIKKKSFSYFNVDIRTEVPDCQTNLPNCQTSLTGLPGIPLAVLCTY